MGQSLALTRDNGGKGLEKVGEKDSDDRLAWPRLTPAGAKGLGQMGQSLSLTRDNGGKGLKKVGEKASDDRLARPRLTTAGAKGLELLVQSLALTRDNGGKGPEEVGEDSDSRLAWPRLTPTGAKGLGSMGQFLVLTRDNVDGVWKWFEKVGEKEKVGGKDSDSRLAGADIRLMKVLGDVLGKDVNRVGRLGKDLCGLQDVTAATNTSLTLA